MDLVLFGTSYKTAPVETRESYSLSKEEIFDFLPRLKSHVDINETLAISTCNRTELFAVCKNGYNPVVIARKLSECKKVDISPENGHFYLLKNLDAARHLFRVSAGLESQMVGENQIKGQIKDAYKMACALKTNGTVLNKLFHMAFRVGKVIRSETNLGAGAVSISSAAVELANHIYETLDGKCALLIGAGETGELVAKHLLERGVTKLKITNRTRERAEILAKLHNAEVVDYNNLAEEFFNNDIVISATSSPEYVLTPEMIKPFVKANKRKRVMVVDIAVPRDVDPKMADFNNVFVYDLDDLKVIVEKNIKDRESEIPYAEKIVEKTVGLFDKWRKEQKVVPTIKFLQESFEDVRVAELEKYKHCANCSKRGELDEITKMIIKKILWAPITKLVEDTDCTEAELKYLRNLFSREEHVKQ